MSVDPARLEEWDRYHELFSWAPLGYARLTFTGRVCEMNYTGADLLEVKPTDVLGQPLAAYVAKGDRVAFVAHLARACRSSETIDDELYLRSAGGHRFPVWISTRRSPHPDQESCWTIFADLTEHRRRSAAHGTDARDRFVAALSHELRTPLTPVLMATSMLSTFEGLPAPVSKMVETIRRNVEREARLIDDLLDVSRLTQHTMLFDRQTVNAHALLADAVTACATEASAKGLSIALDVSAVAAHIEADPGRMRQAFQHLLANAVKFTATGRISIVTANQRPHMLDIAITDSGAGLSSSKLAALFEPLEPHMSHGTVSGLGLGLTICKGIVEAHGGQVTASSPGPGRGSTFAIHLPLATGHEPQSSAGAPQENGAAATRKAGGPSLRILVVEDHTDSGAMLDLLLTSRGHTVAVAGSVAGALLRSQEDWDVVISDLGLPDGSGLEIGRVMRALPHPPHLIALSGYGRPADVAASREAGFDIHLVKPLDPDRLFEILEAGR